VATPRSHQRARSVYPDSTLRRVILLDDLTAGGPFKTESEEVSGSRSAIETVCFGRSRGVLDVGERLDNTVRFTVELPRVVLDAHVHEMGIG